MLDYEKLKKDPKRFLLLTGLTRREFEALLPQFENAYRQLYPTNSKRTQAGRKRRRRVGGGRRGKLSNMTERLLFVLVYQKAYPLQAIQAELFEMDQSSASRWIQRLLPALRTALAAMGLLPERDPTHFSRQERKHHEGVDVNLIIDGPSKGGPSRGHGHFGTERRRQRPQDPEKQALHYSGKKKAHTDKNVLVVNARTQRVGFLSQTYPGTVSDKKIAEQAQIHYPRKTHLQQDLGFLGYGPDVLEIRQPKKGRFTANSPRVKSVPMAQPLERWPF